MMTQSLNINDKVKVVNTNGLVVLVQIKEFYPDTGKILVYDKTLNLEFCVHFTNIVKFDKI